MKPEEIFTVAAELDCHPPATAVTFAKTIADRCAAYADACAPGSSAGDAAARIRAEFGLLR